MTVMVSSAHTAVGARCGLVQHGQVGPAHPQACAVAISREAGQHPNNVTKTDTRGAARLPAMQRARSWTSPQVWADGMCGFTCDHARRRGAALGTSSSVNLLNLLVVPVLSRPPTDAIATGARTQLGSGCLGSVMSP